MLHFIALLQILATSVCLVGGSIKCESSLEFGETYTLSVDITAPKSVCYQLDSSTEEEAVRVFAGCEDAPNEHPVLVTVRQSRGVTSWPLPFVESGHAYTSIHRTLCPLLNVDEVPGESSILVDLSTSSTRPLNFTLRVSLIKPYKLELNRPQKLVASPSSPSYLLFDYPPGVNKVKVRVTSLEESRHHCAIVSIQNVFCPAVELQDNPDDRGRYQTIKSIAAFNVEKDFSSSRYEFFYVVLFVFPHDGRYGDCDYTEAESVEAVSLSQCVHSVNVTRSSGSERVKRVMVTVEPALSNNGYLVPVGLVLGCLTLFYLISCFWIYYFDTVQHEHHPMYQSLKMMESEVIERVNTPTDNLEEGKTGQDVPSPLLMSGSSVRQRLVGTEPTQSSVPTPHSRSPERQADTRPPVENISDLAGRPKSQELTSLSARPRCQAISSELFSSRPTFMTALAGVHWRAAAKRASTISTTTQRSHGSAGRKPRPTRGSLSSPPTPITTSTPPTSPTHSHLLSRDEDNESTVADTGNELEDEVGGADSEQSDSDEEIEYKYDTPTFPVKVLLSELGRLDEHQRGFDSYPIYLLVVGTFYALPVFQLLVTYRYFIMATGNGDICYYNFLCSHPLTVWGIPLSAVNNLFSNVAFLTLGLLLILVAYRRRQLYKCYVEMNRDYSSRKHRKGVPQQFGIYYALGVAMMGQAVLSMAYHMCPTQDNFKFDATFIYIQAGLGIHKLLQSRAPHKNPRLHEIMLGFTLLMLAVVIGMVLDRSVVFWLVFSALHLVVTVLFVLGNYYSWQVSLKWEGLRELMSFYQSEGAFPPRHKPKFVLAVVVVLLNAAFAFYGILRQPSRFTNYIIFLLLSNFMVYLLYYVLTKLVYKELSRWCYSNAQLFAILSLLCWSIGLVYFIKDPTEWNLSPALSRDQNQDCLLMGFYDSHDIWHFLSGFAMFFSSMFLMTLDDHLDTWTRDKIMTF